ncbi:MAG: carboxypeptidase M32 [Halodesulfurarchaeum sp.]
MPETSSPPAYRELLERYGTVTNLYSTQRLLNWDQEVMMPEGGTPGRSKQLSTISSLQHEHLTADRTGELLDELDDADLDPSQRAVVREIRREYERNVRVPRELVEEISETSSEALPIWKEARAEDDFDHFADTLETLVDLRREYAEHIDPDRDPYEVLFEDYEPYLGLDTAERVLGRLRDTLVPLIDDVRKSDVSLADPFEGTFDPEAQEAVAREALDALGYDWDRGRLDRAPHPFSSGTQFDARVTTRFDESEPLDSLLSTVHEFGHARYTLGLSQEDYGSPLGQSRDMTVHESQSRLWENHVARSRPFWDFFRPTLVEHFPQLEGVEPATLYRAANQVDPDNLIRVEADEVTYHMHIVLRFEIERDLIQGDLDVAEVPKVWNDKMEEYLGIRPDTDADGCLQDIHWSHGSFGYFPTYSMGSVLAAQFAHHAAEDIGDLDAQIREGRFGPLADWLETNVHSHGCRFRTDDLVQEATGESYTADHFISYIEGKFGELYDL